jgi:hypothetical protein
MRATRQSSVSKLTAGGSPGMNKKRERKRGIYPRNARRKR